MGEEILKKFGRYFLLDRLAAGGMAEIYRARPASADGAGRIVVIKRIQTGFGGNDDFLQMFKSEIKVTMGFNHPNIVQLYDFGETDNQPYIVMEYLDGKNLRQLISKFVERKEVFPVELAVFIIEQSAAGLQYAHMFKDKITGDSLNIVHRDISPQNILITYEGNIKIIDFGIAKATMNNREATRVGVIKGKPSYLSPEQVSGQVLDGRSDVFALGIVLWELLTSRKLFAAQGESEFAVLKLIESCNTHVKPPSIYNPKIPKELDAIVLQALTKEREKRFQSASELQRALHKFLHSFAPEFNPADLSHQTKKLFHNEIVEDRKRLQDLNAKIEQLMSEEIPDAPTTEASPEFGIKREDTTTFIKNPSHRAPDVKFDPKLHHEKLEIEMQTTTYQSGIPAGARNRSGPVIPRGETRVFPVEKKSKTKRVVSLTVVFAASILFVAVSYLRFSPGEEEPAVVDRTPTTTREPVKVDPPAPSTKSILLKLNVTPQLGGVVMTLNGQKVDAQAASIRAPMDQPLELIAEKPGFKSFKREFVIESSNLEGRSEWTMDVPLEPLAYGVLSISSTPSADVTIREVGGDGKPWVMKTPIESLKIAVGTYQIKMTNEVLGMEKELTIKVEEGKSVREDIRLDVR